MFPNHEALMTTKSLIAFEVFSLVSSLILPTPNAPT